MKVKAIPDAFLLKLKQQRCEVECHRNAGCKIATFTCQQIGLISSRNRVPVHILLWKMTLHSLNQSNQRDVSAFLSINSARRFIMKLNDGKQLENR
ncbi:hypothetical protein I7I50_05574 [Histoplasma capsulatum G186AR]|uniref:Uncharacterized protein n=1 Tax=Ajellomyces capsulatus TaxID=5037 RepID=A0A8H7Z759_AJECA|nr:hypothetical protein I7I52_03834 [Histoplasma capsulatum]QSS76203.1 hypothetical protein I7I50_05574 [Histoplasma capsulatum G186AR]